MKKILLFFFVAAVAMMFSGCAITKHVAYFQNMDSVDISQRHPAPETHIKTNDELTILVSSTNPEAAEPFNLNINSRSSSSSSNQTLSKAMYCYIVDADGFINYPVIGKVKVVGLTRPQVEQKLAELIKPYFAENENPVVKVRMSGFRITIIGEVGSSKVINVDNERISIIEALASAGDLTIYGKRPNVLLIRENSAGEKLAYRYNMNDANIFNSPYYYLEQNDIVYIEPHKAKARNADVNAQLWQPLSSLALSVATLIISLTK
ncbi:MAG: polysaccharide biosynthesis/export family protein [Prevotella sp.]|nr:polysaccharide biosynthesis/export family protein [Candidatus Prevotella equi]